MIPNAILLATALAATPALVDERPLWAGSLQPTSRVLLVSAVPAGIGVRSGAATAVVAGDVSAALGPALCPGASPRLAIPAGRAVYLLGPGEPASLVATASLPAQAISAAVPVTTASGCRVAVALQSGDVALVGPSGEVEILAQVVPAVADWHELPRGVLVASRQDLLVVGGVEGKVAAVSTSDGRRFAGTLPVAAVPGAVWSEGELALWFLDRDGSLHAWKVTSGSPVLVAAGTTSAPGGLVSWGGRVDRGIAWTDMQGDVRTWKDGAVRKLVRLPAGARWPMLVADIDDAGDLELVVPVDGPNAALVADDGTAASFKLVPLAARPAGSPVAYQLDRQSPTVLAFPAGATRGAFQPSDGLRAGRLVAEGAILNPGAQVHGFAPGAVTASLVVPPPTGGSTGPTGPTGPTGSTGPAGGSATETATTKSGFSCATAPSADALPLLLAPLLLLRRRRALPGLRGSRAS